MALKYYDSDKREWQNLPVVQSSAYLAAVAGGYAGTEEEFNEILADALTHTEANNSYVQKSNLATVAGQSLQDGGNVDLQINHISDLNDRLNNIDSAIESKQPILFKQSSNQGVYQVIDPLYPNSANGHYSFATGYRTEASGDRSHAEGEKTKATKRAAHAEGQDTEASGQNSHAEGYWSKATGTNSHAEGRSTIASGANSHAGGEYSEASGGVSFATGSHTKATNMYEFACGHYNKSDKDTIFSVGCGSNENSRQNAFELKNDKTAYVWNNRIITYNEHQKDVDGLNQRIETLTATVHKLTEQVFTLQEYINQLIKEE